MRFFNKSLTLLELLIALGLFSVIVLTFTSIQYFSHFHVVTSGRQSLLQNEISFALEHMAKFVSQAPGYPDSPAIIQLGTNDGFSVAREHTPNPPGTPGDPTDDTTIVYRLQNINELGCSLNNEMLSRHILANVVIGPIPSPLPANPSGFYFNITNPGPAGGSVIEVALVARWQPANPVSLDNPQVVMKTLLYARGSASQ